MILSTRPFFFCIWVPWIPIPSLFIFDNDELTKLKFHGICLNMNLAKLFQMFAFELTFVLLWSRSSNKVTIRIPTSDTLSVHSCIRREKLLFTLIGNMPFQSTAHVTSV